MTEPRPDDTMIEIGDMDDEPTPAAPEPPRVVIEYRDRGIPWMLVPPLIGAAVVVAFGVHARFNPRKPAVVVVPTPAVVADSGLAPTTGQPATAPTLANASGEPDLLGKSVPDPVVVENPPSLPPALDPAADTPAPGNTTVPPPAQPVAVAPETPPPGATEPALAPEPPVFVGLDPKLFANPPVEAPKDPGLAAVAQTVPAGKPTVDLPEEIETEILPPDPRQSLQDRQRRAIEARRELEAERTRFHAAVSQVIRQSRERAAPRIHTLCQEFKQDVQPAAINRAKVLLGKSGTFAGATTGQRIALLRRLGFPEPMILGDIYDISIRHEASEKGVFGGRDHPGQDPMYIQAALTLLKYPPSRPPVANARAVSAPAASPRP